MKKLSLLLLTLLLASSLIACNTDGTETTDPDDTAAETMEETETEAPETEPPVGTYPVDSGYHHGAYIVADFNVLHFGAVGDGVADDTAAIKGALAAAVEAGGGTVYLPVGNYRITEQLELTQGVTLMGELEEGTANGTVLHACFGKGDADAPALIKMHYGSALRGLAVYYPEQALTDGEVIPYPYTVERAGESLFIENVTLVNAYNGFDFSASTLITARSIHGTILNTGLLIDESYDITRIEDVNLSADYWTAYGGDNAPDPADLKSYLHRHAVGIIVGKIDWTYITDITIDSYLTGFSARNLEHGTSHGQLYNLQFTNCYEPFVIEDLSPYGYIVANSTFEAVGDENATAVVLSKRFNTTLSFIDCTISSEGKYAITNNGIGAVTAVNSTVTAAEDPYYTEEGISSFVNSTAEGEEVFTGDLPTLRTDVDYNRVPALRPASDAFINMGEAPYSIQSEEDITERLQAAIDSLKETGGMVYLPVGNYYVEDSITVHSGVELRGPMDAPHNHVSGANLYTTFGKDDPDGEAFINMMAGSGMRGLNVVYYEQMKDSVVTPYSFVIRGHGEDIYLCNVFVPASYNLLDLASARCDDHYVQGLWAYPMNQGIVVGGGSENGIVRDCHFNPNVHSTIDGLFHYNTGPALGVALEITANFVIGESKNQIMYHNFSWGSNEGILILDGAQDAYLLACGIDSGNHPLTLKGNCTAQLVNTQLVNLNGSDPHAVITDETFTGEVSMMNTATWGIPKKSSVIVNGSGTFAMVGGRISNDFTLFEVNGGTSLFAAIQETNYLYGFDVVADKAISSITLVGNLFANGGNYRTRGVDESKLIGFDK